MARTYKSFWKLCRREGVSLYIKGAHAFTQKPGLQRREYPPGQHVYRRIKSSEYGLKLRETQKVKEPGYFERRRIRREAERAERERQRHEQLARRVDEILQKIARSGMDSLNSEEQRILREETHRQRSSLDS